MNKFKTIFKGVVAFTTLTVGLIDVYNFTRVMYILLSKTILIVVLALQRMLLNSRTQKLSPRNNMGNAKASM